MTSNVLVMASAFVCLVFLVCAVTLVTLSTIGVQQDKAVKNVGVTSMDLSERTVTIRVIARARQILLDLNVINALLVTMVFQKLEGE